MRDKALMMFAVTLILASSAWAASSETVIYNFDGGSGDGYYLYAGMIADKSGNLYGTTYAGGAHGYGTVFELKVSGGVWTETVLYSFTAGTTDGAYPEAPLTFDAAGNLYGTTYQGGASDYGTVFELALSKGKWTESIIHSFGGYPDDGSYPKAGVTFDAKGNLYGTTLYGGTSNEGSVFQMKPSKGKWSEEAAIISFASTSGAYPYAPLLVGKSGYFYGTTYQGGANGYGAVYRIYATRVGWVEQVIFSFSEFNSGTYPYSGLSMDSTGNLYGTTYYGGADNYGTVYKMTEAKNKTWSLKVLHSFTGGGTDGEYPYVAVPTLDASGDIYGTTYQGGTYGYGTVYELKDTKGKYKESLVHSFDPSGGADGYYPYGGITIVKGNLYGTTYEGGSHSGGVAFEIKP
jgi:uncharacterized repeat protein (TIGR03803 family)